MAGKANRIMKAMARSDHTNTGNRLTVMPGARSLNVVTTKFTAPAVVAMPLKITARHQKSMLCPGE